MIWSQVTFQNNSWKSKHSLRLSSSPDWQSLFVMGNKATKSSIFEIPLEDVPMDGALFIPKIIVECIKHVEKNQLSNGIYRWPARMNKVNKLKENVTFIADLHSEMVYRFFRWFQINRKNNYKIIATQDVHAVTNLLRTFFKQAKSKVIPVEVEHKLIDLDLKASTVLTSLSAWGILILNMFLYFRFQPWKMTRGTKE